MLVIPAGGTTVAVANELTPLPQRVTIAKTVTGTTRGYDGAAFDLTLNCDGMSAQTFQLVDGASRSFQIDTGTRCQVGEAIPADPAGYNYAAPSVVPASFTVPAGGRNVAVINTLSANNQSVTIESIVVGPSAGYVPGSRFDIQVVCDGLAPFTIQVGRSASQTFSAPTGVSCLISQAGLPAAASGYSYGIPSINPGTVVVPVGGATVTVTNSLLAAPQPLTVTKRVSGDTAGYSPGTTFAINVNCGGTISTLTLADGQSDSTVTAPTGTICVVSEMTPTDPSGYSYDPPRVEPSSFTMGDGGQMVSVTNNLNMHHAITISKIVTGHVAAYSNEQFCIRVICDDPGGERILWLRDGESDASIQVPAGTQCTVMKDRPADPPDCSYDSAQIDPAVFSMAVGGQVVTVVSNLRLLSNMIQPVPVNPFWLLLLTSLGIAGLACARHRRR